MTKQKNIKKCWKKSPEYLQRMIKISIFANDKCKILKPTNVFLKLSISMQEDNTKRDSELEKKIIPALIIYVCEHNESLIGGILKSVTSKKESIEKVWNNFFYIASVDEKNYRNICNIIYISNLDSYHIRLRSAFR